MRSVFRGDFTITPKYLPGLSTGFKLFLILGLALLPLAMIAFFTTLHSTRTVDLENQAAMRIALQESSRKISLNIASDAGAMQTALQTMQRRGSDSNACIRLKNIMAAHEGPSVSYAIFGSAPKPLCRSDDFTAKRADILRQKIQAQPSLHPEKDGLSLSIETANNRLTGIVIYSRKYLIVTAVPNDFQPQYNLSILADDVKIPLVRNISRAGLAGKETLSTPIGRSNATLEMTVVRDPFTTAELLSSLLPLIMWIAAAVIGWLVVHHVLIRPLRLLEQEVSGYVPGIILSPLGAKTPSALELRQLGATFHTITQMISKHEAELAQSLTRQTKLTREVHHRVKNNLQVVASLINLHARGITDPIVIRAYATIQRRVDALAVVHRNHYAELEDHSGVALRSLISELAQNLRGSVPEGEQGPSISLSIIACNVTQDVAVPIAFLLTELVELAILSDPGARIVITAYPGSDHKATLTVLSPALIETDHFLAQLQNRYGRVLEGLSRQLRSPLRRDGKAGSFTLDVPILEKEKFE